MRIETLYDQGAAEFPEDRTMINLPFAGVADGVSGLYLPPENPTLFGDRTGGQMATDCLVRAFAFATAEDTLDEVLGRANKAIRQAQEHLRFYANGQIESLAGTTFALAKIGAEEIEIVQCGDCRTMWITAEGLIGITPNQVFAHEREARWTIAELMQKHNNNRDKMWQEFSPILTTMRRQRTNQPGGYGLMNGQPEALKMVLPIILPRAGKKNLLLWTDGLAYWEETENDRQFGERIFELYRQGGLQAILEYTRMKEKKYREISHIDYAEASGIAITF